MQPTSWVLHARDGQKWFALPEEAVAEGLIGVQSTRFGGVSGPPYDTLNLDQSVGDAEEIVRTNRERFFRAVGVDPSRIAFLEQVHGAKIVVASEPGPQGEGDGLLTAERGLFLSLSVADCPAVFLIDRRQGLLGLVHAGWRGTCARIVRQAIDLMGREFGANPSDFAVGFGAAIWPCCYAVDESVRDAFAREGWRWETIARQRWDGEWDLDLELANRLLLEEAGVEARSIVPSPACTGCRDDLLFSHRRSGGKTGRMLAVLGWRDE